MAMQSKLMLWMSLLAGLVCGLSLQVVAWVLKPGPPMEIVSAAAATKSVKRGADVVIEFSVHRSRSCPAQIYGFLLDESGAAVVRYEAALAGYSAIGNSVVTVRRPIPSYVPPGRLCYRHTRIDACADGTFITPQRDVCFEVIP